MLPTLVYIRSTKLVKYFKNKAFLTPFYTLKTFSIYEENHRKQNTFLLKKLLFLLVFEDGQLSKEYKEIFC